MQNNDCFIDNTIITEKILYEKRLSSMISMIEFNSFNA
jgi:hypothetical protein